MLNIMTIWYNRLPSHIALGDATHLMKALAKRWPLIKFSLAETSKDAWSVQVPSTDDHNVPTFRLFAEGFLASAHLWER